MTRLGPDDDMAKADCLWTLRAPDPAPCHGGCGARVVGSYCPACAATRIANEQRAEAVELVRAALAHIPTEWRVVAFDDRVEAAPADGLHPVSKCLANLAAARGAQRLCAPAYLPLFTVLLGAAGAGKTSLAAAMYRAIVERAHGPRATSAQGGAADIERARRAFWTSAYAPAKARAEVPLGKGEAPLVDRCIYASLLVIDDFAEEPVRSSAMSEIVIERFASHRPTILTTKRREAEVAKHYPVDPEGITRRVYSAKTSKLIPCGAP